MAVGRARRLPIILVGVGVLLVLGVGTIAVSPAVRAALAPLPGAPNPVDPSSGSASASLSAGRSGPTGSIDDVTRRVTVNGASMVLPADPYALSPDPMYVDDVFDVCFLAEATVHGKTAATPGWAAMVGLAHLDPDLDERLATEGPSALTAITREFFGSYRTRISDATSTPTTVGGRPALRIQATVHYAVTGLPSTHDDVTAVVVDLGPGGTVIAMASVPDDAPAELRQLAEASLASLSVS